jgi:hypothetical protein
MNNEEKEELGYHLYAETRDWLLKRGIRFVSVSGRWGLVMDDNNSSFIEVHIKERP